MKLGRPPRTRRRTGLTLLEVILSLTLLVIAMVLIGQLVSIGNRSARAAQDLTRAQMLCASKIAEIEAGILYPTTIEEAQVPEDPDWLYAIEVQPIGSTGLMQVTVSAWPKEGTTKDLPFSLTRWIMDPYAVESIARATALAESAAGSGTSGSGTSSSGTGSSGARQGASGSGPSGSAPPGGTPGR